MDLIDFSYGFWHIGRYIMHIFIYILVLLLTSVFGGMVLVLSEATFDQILEFWGGSNQGAAIFTIKGGSGGKLQGLCYITLF